MVGSTVLGRSTNVAAGSATIGVVLPAGPHEVTAEFLGTPEALGSTGSATFTVAPSSDPPLVVEAVATGAGAEPTIEPGSTGRVRYTFGRPEIALDYPQMAEVRLERDLPGVGPVSVALQPSYPVVLMGIPWVGIQGTVAPGGAVTVTAPSLGVRVHRITVGGQAWGVRCDAPTTGVVASGQLTEAALSLHHEATVGPVPETSACPADRAALVDQVLGGSFAIDVVATGTFSLPMPSGVETTTVAVPATSEAVVHDRVRIDVDVTYPDGSDELPATGTVRLLDGTTEVGARFLVGGAATLYADPVVEGPAAFTVTYEGPGLPSSDVVVIDVAPLPAGRAATGSITIGGVASPLPPGTVWAGGAYDAATGTIGPGHLAGPVGTVVVPNGPFGLDLVTQSRLVQVGDATGHVLPDGTVVLGPMLLAADARSADLVGSLRDCVSEPFEVTLTGTADADGLHLAQAGIVGAPFPEGSCGGQAVNINNAIRTLDLSLEVDGDFTPPDPVATTTSVVSWFAGVAQHDQTGLTARVVRDGSSGPEPVEDGVVDFLDGDEVVASVAVGGGGTASALVVMGTPGTREVTARYRGGGILASSSGTTSVAVAPAPVGGSLEGSIALGGHVVAVGDGAVLRPPTAGAWTGASAWFLPTALAGAPGSFDDARADVRLIQLAPFTVDSDGVHATFVLHVRSVSSGGATWTPLGCGNLVEVAFAEGTGGGLEVVSGTSSRIPGGWCGALGGAWVDELTGPVTGALEATSPVG